MKKLLCKRKLKVNEENIIIFDESNFVYTEVTLDNNMIYFNGVYIEKIEKNSYIGYKESSIELEVAYWRNLYFWLLSFISTQKAIKEIRKYIKFYNNSKVVNVTFDNLKIGPALGYFKCSESKNSRLMPLTFESLINSLAKNNFKSKKVEHRNQCFEIKAFSQILYTKIG